MKVLDNIKSIRKSKGFSQEYMAEKLHIHTINYGKIENGKTALTVERMYKIAEILGSSVSELLDEQTDLQKENINLKNENENLKIVNFRVESERNKIEMAVENWEELKNLRHLVSAFEYLDYIDIESFKKENGKHFVLSINQPFMLVNEFVKFYFRMGKSDIFNRIKSHLDLDKFKESDLILEESKNSGRSVEQIIKDLKRFKKDKGDQSS